MLAPSMVAGKGPRFASGKTRLSRVGVLLQALLLAAPLAGLAAWIARGGFARTHTPGPPPSGESVPSPAGPLTGLPPPLADLPAARLEERVDGAAEYLRREGCRRLLAWRFEDPPADLEVLVFDGPEGARAVLARDAGPERTAGPGEEAAVSEQSILFRRGPVYARLFADPSTVIRSGSLEPVGERVDRALRSLAETRP